MTVLRCQEVAEAAPLPVAATCRSLHVAAAPPRGARRTRRHSAVAAHTRASSRVGQPRRHALAGAVAGALEEVLGEAVGLDAQCRRGAAANTMVPPRPLSVLHVAWGGHGRERRDPSHAPPRREPITTGKRPLGTG
jgi:hypothetical protein